MPPLSKLGAYMSLIPHKFFEWTQMDFPKEVYSTRRKKLLKLLEAENALLLIPSRHGPGHDTFRQNDNFNYFTGLELPDSILALDTTGICLYTPHTDSRFSSHVRPNDFPGRNLFDDPALQPTSGLEKILPFEEFEPFLKKQSHRKIYLDMPDRKPLSELQTSFIFNWNTTQGFAWHLLHTYPQLNFDNGYKFIAILRMVKDNYEIDTMKKAMRITEESILATLPLVKPGVDERTLIGNLENEYRKRGSQRVAFDSIIKGGLNSHCAWRILGSHYNRRNQILKNNDAVVFDVGAEYNHYICDIGRTFPVGDAFTPTQFEALSRVKNVVDAIISAIKPGILLADLKNVALNNLDKNHHKYMQVDSYYGHHIGLASGDPVLLEQPLLPNMVFTVEPWYYNHDTNTSMFIEENIRVTENNAEILSSGITTNPKELEELKHKI